MVADKSVIANNVKREFGDARTTVKLVVNGVRVLAYRRVHSRASPIYLKRVVSSHAGHEVEHFIVAKGTIKTAGFTRATEKDLTAWNAQVGPTYDRLGDINLLGGAT